MCAVGNWKREWQERSEQLGINKHICICSESIHICWSACVCIPQQQYTDTDKWKHAYTDSKRQLKHKKCQRVNTSDAPPSHPYLRVPDIVAPKRENLVTKYTKSKPKSKSGSTAGLRSHTDSIVIKIRRIITIHGRIDTYNDSRTWSDSSRIISMSVCIADATPKKEKVVTKTTKSKATNKSTGILWQAIKYLLYIVTTQWRMKTCHDFQPWSYLRAFTHVHVHYRGCVCAWHYSHQNYET